MRDLTDGSRRNPTNPLNWRAIATTGFVFVVVLVVIGRLTGPSPAEHTDSAPATTPGTAPGTAPVGTRPGTTARPVSTTSTTTRPPGPSTTTGPVNDSATAAPLDRIAADTAARDFVRTWSTPGSPVDRLQAMAPYATTELVGKVADVPAESLPSGQVARVEITQIDPVTATLKVTLDDPTATAVQVGLVKTGLGWRANTISPA